MATDRSDGKEPRAPAPSVDALAALAQLNMGRVLRPLANLATLISAYLHAQQFFFPNAIQRYNPDEAYVTILLTYAGHRELRRWSNDPHIITDTARRGEYYVVGWWTAYFIAVLIANHTLRYNVPDGLESLCMQITAVFFGTLASQHIYKGKLRSQGSHERRENADWPGAAGNGGEPKRLEDQVLAYLEKAQELVKRRELEEEFDISRSSVQRLLDSLQEKGLVQWVGVNRNDPNGGFIACRKGPRLPKGG